MIDVQAELYTIGRQAIVEAFPDVEVSSTAVLKPEHIPFVTIIEQDNSTFYRTSDSENIENHAEVMIEVQAWTEGNDKQSKCRSIMNVIDEAYGKIGLRRLMLSPVTNYNETQLYRMVARYRAVISKEKQIYRR